MSFDDKGAHETPLIPPVTPTTPSRGYGSEHMGMDTTPYHLSSGIGTTPHNDNEEEKSVNNDDKINSKLKNKKEFMDNDNINIQYPDIEIIEIKEQSIKFVLSNCDLSIANALRRIMISEVPTLAMDFVDVQENSSCLDDEFIALRLGLIPLNSKDVNDFKYSRDCDCEDGCPFCSINFIIDICNNGDDNSNDIQNSQNGQNNQNQNNQNNQNQSSQTTSLLVTQKDIINITQHPKDEDAATLVQQRKKCQQVIPVHEDGDPDNNIVLCKLGKKQKLKMHCIARKGIGKEHAKFTPCSAISFLHDPNIILDNEIQSRLEPLQKQEFVESCPTKVYNYDQQTDSIHIENASNCIYCDECIIKAEEFGEPDLVKIQAVGNRFIMNMETTGAMPPEDVVLNAFKVLKNKLKVLKEDIKQLRSK